MHLLHGMGFGRLALTLFGLYRLLYIPETMLGAVSRRFMYIYLVRNHVNPWLAEDWPSLPCGVSQVYHAETLDEQLTQATRSFCSKYIDVAPVSHSRQPSGIRVAVTLPAIFEWYCDDFGNADAQLLQWIAQYLPTSKQKV
eukprot:scaffold158043_cov18-Prasinocladus_malaysianus.AAC.1